MQNGEIRVFLVLMTDNEIRIKELYQYVKCMLDFGIYLGEIMNLLKKRFFKSYFF